jgi:hypothetical protein
MSRQGRSVQYTVRGVPSDLDHALRRKAAEKNKSLNQVILDELAAATIGHRKKADFSDLVGRWIPDPAFDEILSSQRRIDSDKWQ